MKTKKEIVENWLPRYTKRPLNEFTKFILLTNFNIYVDLFAEWFGVEVLGRDGNMPNASANGITIINFGMGSPNAAIIMDILEKRNVIQGLRIRALSQYQRLPGPFEVEEFCRDLKAKLKVLPGTREGTTRYFLGYEHDETKLHKLITRFLLDQSLLHRLFLLMLFLHFTYT